jgi:hypothetical protein
MNRKTPTVVGALFAVSGAVAGAAIGALTAAARKPAAENGNP